jgi:hypothetical protein
MVKQNLLAVGKLRSNLVLDVPILPNAKPWVSAWQKLRSKKIPRPKGGEDSRGENPKKSTARQ